LPLVKPRTIDDVPILALTFHSARYDHYTLRRIAAQVDDAVKTISSGRRDHADWRQPPADPRAARSPAADLAQSQRGLSRADAPAGQRASLHRGPERRKIGRPLLQTGTFFRDADDVGAVVVGVAEGRPIYLRDVCHHRRCARGVIELRAVRVG